MQGTPTSVAMTDGTDRVAPEHWQPRGVTPLAGARERQRGWQLLGQVLVKRGLLTQEQLATAFERQRRGAQRLGRVLVELSMISETALLECLAQQFDKPLMSEEELASLEPAVVRILPEETARLNMIIAIERSARLLVVATADPLNVLALDEVRRVTGLDVDFRIAPVAAIQTAIQRHYKGGSVERDDEIVRQDLGLTVVSAIGAEDTVDLKQLRTQADDPPVVKLVNYVLTRAASDGASDIHVEPFEDRPLIRARIDGLLYELLEVPRPLHLAVVSRLKIISRLDIAERRLPQDGSFSARVEDTEIDFRVSTLPSIHGEKIVLRLLLKEAVVRHYTLESLGFDPDQLTLFRDAIPPISLSARRSPGTTYSLPCTPTTPCRRSCASSTSASSSSWWRPR